MGARILVVDDDPGVRAALESCLARLGHQVSLASSGEDGLRRAAAEKPDLILLDLHMPGVDGKQFLQRMSGMADGAAVVLISGEATVHEVVEAHLLGGGEFLAKPWRTEELAAAIRRALGVQARFRANEAGNAPA